VSSPPTKLVSALLSGLLTTACLVTGCQPGNTYVPPPPPEVTVSLPVRRAVKTYIEYTGATRAIETVDLRARVKGFLLERPFREGADVKKGDLLFVIDEIPFRIQLELARAKLAAAEAALKMAEESKAKEVAKAQLDLNQAILLLARVEENRIGALKRRNAASQDDLDKAQADLKKSAAQVEADKAALEQARADYVTNQMTAQASVAQAQAEVHNAEIDLGYCRIIAPFDGRIGRALYDKGNLVGDGQATVLASIVRTDEIYAYVNVSESDLLMFRKMVREGKRVDFRKGDNTLALDLSLANETGFPHHGFLDYTDQTVDPGTGTLQARGKFPNPGGVIYAGLFCRLRVPLAEIPEALLVPERALAYDQGGYYILVVNGQSKVEQRYVTPGSKEEGGLRVIEGNLKADDQVIIQGLQRARPGIAVNARRLEPQPAAVAEAVPKEAPTALPPGTQEAKRPGT
jgi:RND family efflux transporter MFP subunit